MEIRQIWVKLLVQDRTATLWGIDNRKESEVLRNNVRLSGAWLLTFPDAPKKECKLVLLIMLNNLIRMSLTHYFEVLLDEVYIKTLIALALKLGQYDAPVSLPFSWHDVDNFSWDKFIETLVKIEISEKSDDMLFISSNDTYDKLLLKSFIKEQGYTLDTLQRHLPKYVEPINMCTDNGDDLLEFEDGLLELEEETDEPKRERAVTSDEFVNKFIATIDFMLHPCNYRIAAW